MARSARRAASLEDFLAIPEGSGGPGGWWIATEVEVLLATGEVVRPDVLGWRREHCPERPVGAP